MRHLNEYQHHLRVLLEPYDAKVSRTVLRGKAPVMGLTYSTELPLNLLKMCSLLSVL